MPPEVFAERPMLSELKTVEFQIISHKRKTKFHLDAFKQLKDKRVALIMKPHDEKRRKDQVAVTILVPRVNEQP